MIDLPWLRQRLTELRLGFVFLTLSGEVFEARMSLAPADCSSILKMKTPIRATTTS